MKKEMNNKGFSLVELIIVIAIMAVLVGILAPQYLKYVKNSKISTDIANAQEIATAINTAIASEATIGGITSGSEIAGNAAITGIDGFTKMPVSKTKTSYVWKVTFDATNGVTQITLGATGSTVEIYPDAISTTHFDPANR